MAASRSRSWSNTWRVNHSKVTIELWPTMQLTTGTVDTIPIAWTQLRPLDRLLEHRHLLSQCQILDGQPGFGNEYRSQQQNTRLEKAHFHTREIRKWAIVAAHPRAGANDVSPCQSTRTTFLVATGFIISVHPFDVSYHSVVIPTICT